MRSWPGANARLQDHRLAMVAAGLATLLLSIVLFGTLSTSFFPPQNSDYSRANITMAPGSTLKDTEVVVDRVAAVIGKDPNVDRVFERINVGEGHVNIVLKKKRPVTSTEFERNLSPVLAAMADARVSFQSQQGGGPDADSRDVMLYLGGEDPAQLKPWPTKSPRKCRPWRGFVPRASEATSRSPKSRSSRGSTSPPISE